MDSSNGNIFVVREWGKDLGFNLEIAQCLREFYGDNNVDVLVIPNTQNTIEFFRKVLITKNPQRIFMDTRIFIVDAAMPSLLKHLVEVSRLNRILRKAGKIPVCIITDSKEPGFLLVAELLTHKIGIIVPTASKVSNCAVSRKSISDVVFNPISIETSCMIRNTPQQKVKDLYIGGLMYEPRKSFMEDVMHQLIGYPISIEVVPKRANLYKDYILELSAHKIVLNTNYIVDSMKTHMVARNIETLHSGSLLITQNTYLLEKYFTAGVHYIHVGSPLEAAMAVKYYLENEYERESISKAGQDKAIKYAESKMFTVKVERKLEEIGLRKSG